MLIKSRSRHDISSADITSESAYYSRRQLIKLGALAGIGAMGASLAACADELDAPVPLAQPTDFTNVSAAKSSYQAAVGEALSYRSVTDRNAPIERGFHTSEALTPYRDITRYNNFYEFGTDKTDPARYAKALTISPWSLRIEGEVDKPGDYFLEDVLAQVDLEERIYRLRCVEAWSMVVPWVGFPLASLLKRVMPNSKARYVAFETVHRPKEMRGQRSSFSTIDWPYVEGLRIDEAMHPLTILAVGVYGKSMPKQNGAPLRLVVPWKYGFKSIKSIVSIRLQESQPETSWNLTAPNEYGFYSNVNPSVSHPRWSQAYERRLPSSLFNTKKIPTLPFNGYADQVASLYSGMDLKANF